MSDSGDVQIYVDGATADANALRAAGLRVERLSKDGKTLQGRAQVDALDAISAVAGVTLVREPDYAFINAGSAQSQGDTILAASTLRSNYGVNGTGVRVGVLSSGLEGMSAAQASGDLPAINSTTCDAIDTVPVGEPDDPTDVGAGAEGTAMLEIVHDLAPGAELWFGYFGINTSSGSSLDYMAAVDCLAAHTDIVVDDIGFLNAGLYDGTSTISQNAADELANPSNPIRGYYTAAGNLAMNHYQESFVNSGQTLSDGAHTWQLHRFAATASTTDGGLGLPCTALPADGFCGDSLIANPGAIVQAWVQWNDPWTASSNDYSLFFLVETPAPAIYQSDLLQTGTQNPRESLGFFNDTGAPQFVDVMLGRLTGVARTFDMFVICTDCQPITGKVHNFNTTSSSIANNADASGGVMAIGAINAIEPGNDLIASYSSRGPTNDLRNKPDLTAIDGVAVTGSGGFFNPFYGTSAASPHAAAIAALVLSCKPSLLAGTVGENPAAERTALKNALTSGALDLGAAGVDTTYGAGRANANSSAVAAGCTTDGDADGTLNATDNCPTIANAPQTNTDGAPISTSGVPDITVAMSDKLGDACDADDDNDGIDDDGEAAGCNGSGPLDPLNADSDDDRVRDGAECVLGSNPADAGSRPPPIAPGEGDGDGLPDALEIALGSNPNSKDSDSDGFLDGIEYRGYSTSPAQVNSDGDGCADDTEAASVNNDTSVNVIDLLGVAQHVPGTLAAFDVNKDRSVNVVDLLLVAQNVTSSPC
ncbi:MAG TPA: S8 family serine peptidase [Dehalococcoidia bacterium]